MVRMLLKPSLTPRQPCQQLTATSPCAPGALRGFVLECAAHAGKVVTTLAYVSAIPGIPITGVGNICTAKVDAKASVGGVDGGTGTLTWMWMA